MTYRTLATLDKPARLVHNTPMSIELTAAQALTISRIIDGYGPLAGKQVTVSGLPGASTEYPGTLHIYYAPMAQGYRVLTDGTAVRVTTDHTTGR